MNDMTDFDKLIKEKAEDASYPYNEAAWRHFKHNADLHGGSAKYWVVGVASIVAVGTFFLLKQDRQVEPTSDQPVQTAVFTEDSVFLPQDPSTVMSEDTVTFPVVRKQENSFRQMPHHNQETVEEHPSIMKSDTPKVSKKVIHGRPLVIDVDTITRMVPTDEELEKGHSRLY